MTDLAIIGGTGLTSLSTLQILRRRMVRTPYGEPSGPLIFGELKGKEVVFLPRHGSGHTIAPHNVNYRANIWAIQNTGASKVIAVAAVGVITKKMKPASLLFPDQILDYTWGRKSTFNDSSSNKVVHTDFTYPYSDVMRELLIQASVKTRISAITTGVYAATQGPRLESAAEINRIERDGGDVVGMTGMPETVLARELGLEYACCAVGANWAAGRSKEGIITMAEIRKNLDQGMGQVRNLLEALITLL
ncbi:MAG TPA: S-methyl-5'-thioinosine phosphorylase [Gammaproteobacteria bacterium]|nr:S-methyl-5'-thioinosine phosphorylase [Gammaproteobacteria bacterium]